ncbi:MAG: tetratricopeptide repeat protein [Rhodospirillales bacterium]|nr:tetratricopeptide repeat protein [Rhodospirillales bacterium]
MRIVKSLAVFWILFFAVSASAAAPDDARLDRLFERLQNAETQSQAEMIEAQIWRTWIETGDQELDQVMALGISAMRGGRMDVALMAFDTLTEKAPECAEAWNKRATVHFMLGDYESSVADIMKTLSLEPRHFGALSGLGMIYVNIGEKEAALAAFEKALSIHPYLTGLAEFIARERGEFRGKGI